MALVVLARWKSVTATVQDQRTLGVLRRVTHAAEQRLGPELDAVVREFVVAGGSATVAAASATVRSGGFVPVDGYLRWFGVDWFRRFLRLEGRDGF